MSSQPEIHEPVVTTSVTSALVPVRPPRVGRVAGWLQRVTGFVASRRAPAPIPDATPRLDALERAFAAHREETDKRLEQSESRVLHVAQQQIEALARELETNLRKEMQREVEVATGSLRRWLVGAILLALLACGAALAALYATFVHAA
ncbi:MAG TPA: hypothetical protein VMW19_11610 [Myxococcota bacterium]|nr:hypothetical protein [Myxococcota bacterium]